jgi:hypothetical protein
MGPGKVPRAAAGAQTVAVRFRQEIEQAEARGVVRADMILKLTLNDVNKLQRDGDLPLADISFAGGVMRYLGVAIIQGGVAESSLHCGDLE